MMNVSDLTAAVYNPRKINDKALAGLQVSIAEYGDLSGLVVNLTTGNLVAGHQRKKALIAKYGDLPIVDGKIVCPNGDVFTVRFVEWDESKEKCANVAANSATISGSWTSELFPLLEEIKTDSTGIFDALDFDALFRMPFSAIEGEGEQGERKTKDVTCPDCGHTFTPQR